MSSSTPVLFSAGAPRTLARLALDGSAPSELGFGYSERWLQDLIQHCPEVLPIAEIEPGFGRLIPVATEVVCSTHGYIDNLFVTADGGIALVETKLWRNPEARRKVVAQALDYAAALARMSYSEFEKAALSGEFAGRTTKPSSLYEIVANEADASDEVTFIEGVSRNLQRGRMLVVAAGDGIRTEAEALGELLQSHAGARFTFALVAIELFRAGGDQILAVPRTIAKTVLIERGVVRIEDGKVQVEPPVAGPGKSGGAAAARVTMTEELFLEFVAKRNPNLPDALKAFLARIADERVEPDWRASLNLKWYGDRATVNLGYIRKDGTLATDATYSTAKASPAARRYLEDLAALSGGKLVQNSDVVGPYVIAADGKSSVKIDQLLPAKAEAWAGLMGQFVKALEVESASGAAT